MKNLQLAIAVSILVVGCGSGSSGTGGSGGAGGSGGSDGAGGTGGTARACATDIDVGEVQAFGSPTSMFTEGITFDAAGRMFVSSQDNPPDDQLLEISLDGSSDVVAEAESILGLDSEARGIIAAGIATGDILLINPDTGTNQIIASDLGAPNFVVTTPWGTILVSDDNHGENTIDEVTWDGTASTWVEGVPTPNGMVFSLDSTTLYVATTFEEPGLWRVPVNEDGTAGVPEEWVNFAFAGITTPDGVAIDSEGNVYVALNVVSQIAKVAPDGTVTILAEGVSSAASLAFGQGEFDPCSLYVTSLFGYQLWRVGTGVLGIEK
ncbi:MAG: SMP-30/gluconolactonase/LRE family protein [Polyangiales bacterium]